MSLPLMHKFDLLSHCAKSKPLTDATRCLFESICTNVKTATEPK